MEMFRKKQWIWKVIVAVASIALIATSVLAFIPPPK
jgi:type IV secretory pathway component VirB8